MARQEAIAEIRAIADQELRVELLRAISDSIGNLEQLDTPSLLIIRRALNG